MFNKSIADYDCEKIHLTKHQIAWLRLLAYGVDGSNSFHGSHNRCVILPKSEALVYTDYGLAEITDEDFGYNKVKLKISEFGKIYVEYIEEQEKKQKQANFKDWIAIIISIVALIISLMK